MSDLFYYTDRRVFVFIRLTDNKWYVDTYNKEQKYLDSCECQSEDSAINLANTVRREMLKNYAKEKKAHRQTQEEEEDRAKAEAKDKRDKKTHH